MIPFDAVVQEFELLAEDVVGNLGHENTHYDEYQRQGATALGTV